MGYEPISSGIPVVFGEYGASLANLKLMKYIPEKCQLVIRCSHKALEQVMAAIASTIEVNGKAAAIHVVGVSGTLKALSKKT